MNMPHEGGGTTVVWPDASHTGLLVGASSGIHSLWVQSCRSLLGGGHSGMRSLRRCVIARSHLGWLCKGWFGWSPNEQWGQK
jgi:hypothetical protein